MSYAMDIRNMDTWYCREGVEYLQAFWDAIPNLQRLRDLELEFELAVLLEEKNEFHRRVKANDRPGKRHMLPFIWVTTGSFEGAQRQMPVQIRFGSIQYETRMATYAKKINALRSRQGGKP